MKKLATNKSDIPSVDEEWPEEREQGTLRVLLNHRELIRSLVFRDIRSRYKQSALGIAWALLQPIAMMLIFTLLFSRIGKVHTGSVPYPLFAYTGLLMWNFFSQGLAMGSECLVGNINLVTKIYFPREVFPISAILGRTVDLGLGIVVLIPMFVFYKVHLTWAILWVLPILAVQSCLTLGLSFLLSSLNVFYRDVKHVMPLLLQVWMYLTPVAYPLSEAPKNYQFFFILNPMSPIIESYRNVLLHGNAPVWSQLGLATAISGMTLIIGYRIFKKLEPTFAEII